MSQRGYNEAALLWREVIVATPGTQRIFGDSKLEQKVKKGYCPPKLNTSLGVDGNSSIQDGFN